ncbi:MAG: segregation/condensation protein A [Nanoarchaeota archaeon]|nr:segregation/condensation protein A [Nanoarchaeota archaeon]
MEDNKKERLNQDQVYNILTNDDVSWQALIYELINTEQLVPWDIDLGLLAKKYLEKISELEEANFFISSKILLAASILLRLKSDILLNKEIKTLDEILFGQEEKKKYEYERIEIDENELPELYPKTPLPRYRKVTLNELMSALDKAINTETRRIKREITDTQAKKLTDLVLPRTQISVHDRIREIKQRLKKLHNNDKIPYSTLAKDKEEKITCFLPILHLDCQKHLTLQQEKHFEEIFIWLHKND